MAAKIIDGKMIAQKLKNQIAAEAQELKKQHSITPGLATILVGCNPASQIYVKKKEEACSQAGFYFKKIELPETVGEQTLIEKIRELNSDKKIHGILMQLPLPEGIDENKVLQTISPLKDVDGFHAENLGMLAAGKELLVPCTPKGVIRLIESTGQRIDGKQAVVIGRSNIVGKPLALMLLNRNATVTVCHSKTKNLEKITKNADILVSAVGKPRLVKKEMVKRGAIAIDIGITRTEGKIAGDIDFEQVKEIASYITPVPGGVGPMTVACLLENTLLAARLSLVSKK